MMAHEIEEKYYFWLTTYELMGETAIQRSRFRMHLPKKDAWTTLQAVRVGLPSNYTASMTDSNGRNIQPKRREQK